LFDLKFVRENLAQIRETMVNRHVLVDLDTFELLDTNRRKILFKLDKLRTKRNKIGLQRAKAEWFRQDNIFREMKKIGKYIKILKKKIATIQSDLEVLVLTIPNVPHISVPIGSSAKDNFVMLTWGDLVKQEFPMLEHWQIGKDLGIIDFEAAARMTGTRFVVLKGIGARLERALINFMLDIHINEHGYIEVLPPFLVNSRAMTGTGQLPKFSEDLFRLEGTDYWLIPTAEVPLTNLHLDEILEKEQLPLLYTAYTPCFRAEAGSYGKDIRGLIRQHQFNKVELVRIVHPDDSYKHLEILTTNAETILRRLELPYRKVILCTGDQGFCSAKTYDLEVWLPGQECYREISSCSNFQDFQARRIGLRFKNKGQRGTTLVHTLNGSGLAIGRTLVAILENYQQVDGSVIIPEVLRPYLGGLKLISKLDNKK